VQILPNGTESTRLNLGWGINVVDDYSDFIGSSTSHISFDCLDSATALLYSDGSPTKYPINSEIHNSSHAIIHSWLGTNSFFRHGARADFFLRAPYCDENQEYYNGLLNNNNVCDDITPTGLTSPYIDNMATTLNNSFPVWGYYQKNSCDFFFEVEHKTTDAPYIESSEQECFCRSNAGYDPLDPYYEDNPELNLTTIGVPFPPDQDIIPLYNADCPTPHFMCVNCPDWRSLQISKIQALSNTSPSFVLFDEWLMPPPYRGISKTIWGCFCFSCRTKYSLAHGNSPMGQYVNFGTTSIWDKKRNMADHLAGSILEHFEAIRGTLNQNNTLCVQSMKNLPALNNDGYRTSMMRGIDIAKTEWSMPIKDANNYIFGCNNVEIDLEESEDEDEDDEEEVIALTNCQKYAVLGNHHIPVRLRIATGLGILRDGVNTRSVFTWTGNEPFLGTPIDANKRYLHTMGFSYAIGSHLSVTSGRLLVPFDLQPPATTSPNLSSGNGPYKLDAQAYFLTNNQNLTPPIPSISNNIRVFDLDQDLSGLLREKRPLTWAGIYFSETERNQFLYLNNINNSNSFDQYLHDYINANSPLTQGDQNVEGQREALFWLLQLNPMHAMYEAMSNAPIDFGNTTYLKMPTVFYNDQQIYTGKTFGYPKVILSPMPINHPPIGSPNGIVPSNIPLLTQTKDALESLGKPIVLVGDLDGKWYQDGFETNHENGLIDIRNFVLSEIGAPPVYITGPESVFVGFLTDPNKEPNVDLIEDMTVVVSQTPEWGLLRGWQMAGAEGGYPEDAPTMPPALSQIQTGEVVIRIPESSFLLDGVNVNCITATTWGQNDIWSVFPVTVSYVTTNNLNLPFNEAEYIVSLPKFTHFQVVHIDFTCNL
jgi:hypothetical protein